MDLSIQSLTAKKNIFVIQGLIKVGKVKTPLTYLEPYLQKNVFDAILKYISRKTSYHRIWLAFHP